MGVGFDASGEQAAVPEGITRTVSPEEWSQFSSQDPALASKLAEVINKKDAARKDESSRLHQAIGELRAKVDSAVEAKPEQAQPEQGSAWSSLSDEQFFAQASNALDLSRQAMLNPDNDELRKQAAQVDGRAQLQIMEEWTRRKAGGAGEVAKLREELEAERTHQAAQAGMVNGLMRAGLPPEAIRDTTHPLHLKKDELVQQYASDGVTGEAAEYAAWREALAISNRSEGPSTGPRRLDVSALPLSKKYEQDPEVSALRRKGDFASLKEAESLKRTKFFLSSMHNQPRS